MLNQNQSYHNRQSEQREIWQEPMKRGKNASDPVDTGFRFAFDWSRG